MREITGGIAVKRLLWRVLLRKLIRLLLKKKELKRSKIRRSRKKFNYDLQERIGNFLPIQKVTVLKEKFRSEG